jgi:hypothetical protein
VLTPHQRAVLVALTLNDVPIDVLAERRGTTRGALYKTLHDARHKLRGRLAKDGLAIEPSDQGRAHMSESRAKTASHPAKELP